MKLRSLLLSLFSLAGLTCIVGCGPPAEAPDSQLLADKAAMAVVEQRLANFASGLIAREPVPVPNVFAMLSAYLEENPEIFGAAFAMAPPDTTKKEGRSSPYVHRVGDGLVQMNLVDSYDYTEEAWYMRPIEQGEPVWSEPYFDRGGGDIWMITYSIPLYTEESRLIGVVTSDLPVTRD